MSYDIVISILRRSEYYRNGYRSKSSRIGERRVRYRGGNGRFWWQVARAVLWQSKLACLVSSNKARRYRV